MKVLLLPDRPDWAFDRRTQGIIKYNPDPTITYAFKYVIDRPTISWNDWDLIIVFFAMECGIPDNSQKLIRCCYSARWLSGDYFLERVIEKLNRCRGAILANTYLQNVITSRLTVPWMILPNVSDPELFYPEAIDKWTEFTVLFAGHTKDKLKRYLQIVEACKEAEVCLRTVQDLPLEALRKEYNQAHAVINFSIQEGGPAVMVEAALCGTPTIIPEGVGLFDRLPCFIVSDYADLVRKLRELKQAPELCRECGNKAMRVVLDSLTYATVMDKFSEFLHRLCQ